LPIGESHKKIFNPATNENSDEFKNLGTFHRERRCLEYYPPETLSNSKPIPTEVSQTIN
jgi:hypothetical protein